MIGAMRSKGRGGQRRMGHSLSHGLRSRAPHCHGFSDTHASERWLSMAHMPTYSYDKEADVLYIAFAPGETPTAAVELNDNILLGFNLTEKRAIGLTLMDFSVLVQTTQLGPRSFPLSGLKDLEAEWQEVVI